MSSTISLESSAESKQAFNKWSLEEEEEGISVIIFFIFI